MTAMEAATASPKDFLDDDLVAHLDQLARVERKVGAAIVAHLMEIDRRRIHLDMGYSSIFTYAVERLGLSREVAYKRMRVVKAARVVPELIGDLNSGALTLTTAVLFAPYAERGGRELLAELRDQSKRQAERAIAE